ncbi:MAG TPA: NAD-dependent epimerase/dehydratase family protein [Tepidisphaeraceae bacterium]|nr:NAD-dependent epimerase/dehydratase family protein [Tepidisphaeraceae bacterium]
MRILITGSNGFVGRNLSAALSRREGVEILPVARGPSADSLNAALASADVIFHLAGINRPNDVAEYETGNAGFTAGICAKLIAAGRKPKIVFASSSQAELENPYGISKRKAEESLRHYSEKTGAAVVIYRLKNLFGKWCRPNYNSVTATFCHNIAHDLPIQISNPQNVVELTYIDDVIAAFVSELPAADAPSAGGFSFAGPLASHAISLGDLAAMIRGFREHRKSLRLPDLSSPFVRALYATYLSYLETDDFAYGLDIKTDNRGSLAEFLKSPAGGQIFVSRTRPGITRGNHFHHTKTEKFLVLSGEAIIRFRQISGDKVIEYRVKGEDYRVVDIPPGYTHSIENVGSGEMVTLFWASEIFDPAKPDTAFLNV